jgi:hypothetical protein
LRHVIVEDLDDPGHLIVMSERWSQQAANNAAAECVNLENAKRVNTLSAEPRLRTVGRGIASASAQR